MKLLPLPLAPIMVVVREQLRLITKPIWVTLKNLFPKKGIRMPQRPRKLQKDFEQAGVMF
jgi:hypothetical protein